MNTSRLLASLVSLGCAGFLTGCGVETAGTAAAVAGAQAAAASQAQAQSKQIVEGLKQAQDAAAARAASAAD